METSFKNLREWERREGGEWDFRSGSDWRRPGPGVIPINAKASASVKSPSCLCSEKKVSKVMLVIFILINLSMIACGGVVFTLGLTGYWANNKHFAYLMVGSSCFMCWGTLSTTFDILALLGIYQKKRKLLLPWLVWYILEVVAVVGLVMVSTVYSDTFYLLPFLVKPLVTIFAWFNVRYVYKSSLRKFYSRNLSYY